MALRRDGRRWKILGVGLLVVTLPLAPLYGCAGVRQTMGQNPVKATAICAGAGALGLAAAGAAADREKPLRGAIIGAVAGLVAGGAACFTIAKANSKPIADYQQTQQATSYRATQGTLVRVENLTLQPVNVAPGGKFAWHSRYVVMVPEPNADVPVVETRVLSAWNETTREWKEMGRYKTEVTIKPGTREDKAEMVMPKQTTAQIYLVTFQVEHNQRSDQKNQPLFVVAPRASLSQGVRWGALEVTAK